MLRATLAILLSTGLTDILYVQIGATNPSSALDQLLLTGLCTAVAIAIYGCFTMARKNVDREFILFICCACGCSFGLGNLLYLMVLGPHGLTSTMQVLAYQNFMQATLIIVIAILLRDEKTLRKLGDSKQPAQ